jgi:integrase/recombinase XerC
METIGGDANVSEITVRTIRTFMALLFKTGQCGASVHRKVAAIKSLFHWIDEEGIPQDGRILNLRSPKLEKHLPDVPSEKNMGRLCDGVLNTACPERDRVIPELLYGSGLRIGELVAINLSDFKRMDTLLIRGKGRKERMVPVTKCSQDAIQKWLPVREQLLMEFKLQTDALLFSVSPRHSFDRLDVRSAHRILKRIAKSKGLPEYHPHMLRHSCGTHLHDHGVPILAISRLLGHSRLETTEIYTRVSTGRMLDVYRKAHPHAQKSAA